MCGIGFTIRTIPKLDFTQLKTHNESSTVTPLNADHHLSSIHHAIRHAISPRGPDFRSQKCLLIQHIAEKLNVEIHFFASVLHLRGLTLTQQPIVAPETGSLLMWNGEVFDGIPVSDTSNDGQVVLETLEKRSERSIPEILVGIEGPYAFVYFDACLNQVWFGRDPLGRRSLMMLQQKDLSSPSVMSVASNFENNILAHSFELDTLHLFYIDLKNLQSSPSVRQVPRGSPKIVINRQIPLESDRVSLDNPDSSYPSTLKAAVSRLRDSLDISIQRRLRSISNLYQADKHQSQVAILFSGGIDCTTLALLAHFHIPLTESIDLINVAFENPRVVSHLKAEQETVNPDVFSVPDRHTGEASWKELCKLTPGRTWRFVKVDVWMLDYLKYKNQIIKLMHPLVTAMDLSIAAALFFAARGIGSFQLDSTSSRDACSLNQPYRSPARVFLSGLGADELLGGYSRHRSAFARAPPWINLIDELQLDIDRIPTRNLGRDDRIISHFGREVRYPFLDQQVIDTLSDLPVHLKCDFDLGKGRGDKLLLRVLAHELGLTQASKLVKRAIQFGARSAKLERLEKGTDDVKLCEVHANLGINMHRMSCWNGWSFNFCARSLNPKTTKAYESLLRTQADIRTGLFPASLQFSTLIFNSFPVRQTTIIGYPAHIETARSIALNSRQIASHPEPHYEVMHMLNKETGTRATQKIMTGSLILSERPVLILPEKLEAPPRELLDEIILS